MAIVNPNGEKRYSLRLVGLQRLEAPDGKALDLSAAFDLMAGIENPVLRFTCEFIAKYNRTGGDGMPWADFSNAVALAHIIPYLREFVSNMTNRLPVPPLMLDPINTHALVAAYEARKGGTEKATTAIASPA